MSRGALLKPTEIKAGKSLIKNIAIPATMAAMQTELQELNFQAGYVVLWQIDAIRWGKWESGQLYFPETDPQDSLLLEVRVFNENEELHLLKQGESFRGRFRNDSEGEAAEYVDSASRFWGRRTQTQACAGGYIRLVDSDRKLQMLIPAVGTEAEYYALETRSYVGINEHTAQAGYVDYRFKAILPVFVKGDAR